MACTPHDTCLFHQPVNVALPLPCPDMPHLLPGAPPPPALLQWAQELQSKMDELFWDEEGGAYFNNPEGDASILLRLKVSGLRVYMAGQDAERLPIFVRGVRWRGYGAWEADPNSLTFPCRPACQLRAAAAQFLCLFAASARSRRMPWPPLTPAYPPVRLRACLSA